jgi:hypothetical protein
MLTVEDALRHLGYDEADETITRTVTDELAGVKSYMQGAVGVDVFELMAEDPRVDILLKAYLDDLHDDRGTTSAKANNAKRELVNSAEWQLRLTLARKREEAASV